MTDHEKSILELINVGKSVTTLELCDVLQISESTARRLLLRLSDRGLIYRYHGGAMSIDYHRIKSGIQARFLENTEAKDRIAKEAASRVEPGSTIILMGGTSVYKMCKYLKGMKISVITNSMIVFEALKDEQNVELLLLGGKYDRDEMEVCGVITHSTLKMLRADSLFMGTTSFYPGIGFLTKDISSTELYGLCIDAVRTRYILTDSTKLGTKGLAVTATCEQIDCLITDNALSHDMANAFQQAGLEVVLV